MSQSKGLFVIDIDGYESYRDMSDEQKKQAAHRFTWLRPEVENEPGILIREGYQVETQIVDDRDMYDLLSYNLYPRVMKFLLL